MVLLPENMTFTCQITLQDELQLWFQNCNFVVDVKYTSLFLCLLQSSSCSLENPLSCVVGEVSARHGLVSLTERQLFIESNMQLSGDSTGTPIHGLIVTVTFRILIFY